MDTCLKCGVPYKSSGSQYCSNCGAARSFGRKKITCTSCGATLEADDCYCHKCGTRTEVGKLIEDMI